MIEKLSAIGGRALEEIEQSSSFESLDQIRVSLLGKKGSLNEVLKGLAAVSPEERPVMGAAANEWKRKIEAALEIRKSILEKIHEVLIGRVIINI